VQRPIHFLMPSLPRGRAAFSITIGDCFTRALKDAGENTPETVDRVSRGAAWLLL
jgi:hypothetical protein